MSDCKKCGKETKEEAKYCHACGGELSKDGDVLNNKKARVLGPERTWVKPAMLLIVAAVVVSGGLLFKESLAERMGASPAFQPKGGASARPANAVPVISRGNDVSIPITMRFDGQTLVFKAKDLDSGARYF